MRILIGVMAVGLWSAVAGAQAITQDISKRDVLVITDAKTAQPKVITQAGRVSRYKGHMDNVGLQFRTGTDVTCNTTLRGANAVATTVMGAHGKGTHVIYSGHWQGDSTSGYPIMSLTKGGKITWTKDAVVDFTMDENFFTRQLWVHGDGSGVLELEEGFIADRTQDATVANAMGTIRLGGATLITHHSQSLPYNSRPDGRGGIYHNGHVVFENKPSSTWIIKTNQHVYSAQIDFDVDGQIICEKPLTHSGQRRVCLPVGNGGAFVSTGAFRTTGKNVTITKSGPAMLSLEGQQAYLPGAKLIVTEGLVRFHTDPGAGGRVAKDGGAHLQIEVHEGGAIHFGAPLSRVKSITLKPGATMSVEDDVKVKVGDRVKVHAGATLTGADRIEGKVDQP